jgi:hypothetical protein
LRHTFAKLALQVGVPLWKVSKMLGHRDISITLRVYGHLTPEGREDIAGRMQQVLGPRDQATVVKSSARPTKRGRVRDGNDPFEGACRGVSQILF